MCVECLDPTRRSSNQFKSEVKATMLVSELRMKGKLFSYILDGGARICWECIGQRHERKGQGCECKGLSGSAPWRRCLCCTSLMEHGGPWKC
jgi:hypothetical protein